MLGLAYQPYVGQWSKTGNNPYAPGRRYTPAFNTYFGGIDLDHPERSLVVARQGVELRLDDQGKLVSVKARGGLRLQPEALRGADAAAWSRTYFRRFDKGTARPAQGVDNQASVYRQLAYLARLADGAPLTLSTYGTGFQAGYWRTLSGQGYATLPVWTSSDVTYVPAGGLPTTHDRAIDQIYFYFPPTSVFVRTVPERVRIETRGRPGRDLELTGTHQVIFEPADRDEPGAELNPGFFLGDANAQIALAAAEINASAGKTLLTLKIGVDNLAVDGSILNDRMRFGILSGLAQAKLANERHPGTVTHLVITNEYVRSAPEGAGAPTPAQQVTAMVRYAKDQLRAGGPFAGLRLKVGARGNRFAGIDPASEDPGTRRLTADVADLVLAADFLMENLYPSPEAVAAARRTGAWDVYFDPERGELSNQWRQLTHAIRDLPGGEGIDLMIGEIGHPTNGISFNLPGYQEPAAAAAAATAFAVVADSIDLPRQTLHGQGVRTLEAHFNDPLATAFVKAALAWSRAKGVQVHLFEAFDEPHKALPDLPLPGLTPRQSLLSRSGPFGAEACFGLLGYTGVADFELRGPSGYDSNRQDRALDRLPPDTDWRGQFDGRLYQKLPGLSLSDEAHAFIPVISP